MSITNFPDEPDDIDAVDLIDIRTGDRSSPFEHRVEPVSKTIKAIKYLEKQRPDVQISEAAIQRIAYGAVEPGLLDGARLDRHRVETGWLVALNYRAYTLMLSPAIENDRLLDEAHYAADPGTSESQRVLTMPTAHGTDATLVYADPMEDLLTAIDRASKRVRESNPQEVGRRIVERPLTAVPVSFLNAGHYPDDDLSIVDGNSRWASCTANLKVQASQISPATAKDLVPLLPSHLMRRTLSQRRDLVREIVKNAHRDFTEASGTSKTARAKRDRAAELLNAMTVPVQVIVGYIDDKPSLGMQRFPAAVRSLLMRMNVGVKPFEESSKSGVTAEEIVTALFDAGELGDDAPAVKDVLLGRTDVTDAMKTLGLNPAFRDLRFAFVVQQLTRKERRLNAIMAAKLDKSRLVISHRSGPAAELGLRSYSSLPKETMASVRTAVEKNILWKDLADHEWTVENIDSDEAVDDLLARADTGDIPARLLLGVIAMVNLVTSGNLLAAGGTAEQIVGGIKVMRTPVGTVIEAVLGRKEGPQVLADAIKRIRAGLRPRWWAHGQLVEQEDWKGSDFNAHLRLVASHGFDPEYYQNEPTATELEDEALTGFQSSLATTVANLDYLIFLRKEHGTTADLPWVLVEPTFKNINTLGKKLGKISEDEPS
ncbi:hypothetical protein [Kitasatospora sp. NPDC056731]|uniref:hypothetical protein n=1 Tax=Kitasatospora sp. NPDC056731 TaxID=3155422 RepID=UPI003427CC3D